MNIGILKYNGEIYNIKLLIYSPDQDTNMLSLTEKSFDIFLWEKVGRLEFINSLHEHLLVGKLIYKDTNQSIVNFFMERPISYLDVTVIKINANNINPDFKSPNKAQNIEFTHRFLIDSINTINSGNNEELIQFNLISEDIWNFDANLDYSTFSDGTATGKSPLIVLKDLYTVAGVELDLNKLATNARHNYVTHKGTNLLLAEEFLLKRAYDIKKPETPGMVSIYYDTLKKKYILLSLSKMINNDTKLVYDEGDVFLNRVLKIEMFNNYAASLESTDKTTLKLFNITNNSEIVELLQPVDFHTFNYQDNKFEMQTFTSEELLNTLPNLKGADYQKKYYDINNMISKVKDLTKLNYSRSSSTWYNKIFMNNNIRHLLCDSTNAVVNTHGDLTRQPGEPFLVSVDRTDNNPLYKCNGEWSCFKVHHIFGQDLYRNNIYLARLNVNNENIQKTLSTFGRTQGNG